MPGRAPTRSPGASCWPGWRSRSRWNGPGGRSGPVSGSCASGSACPTAHAWRWPAPTPTAPGTSTESFPRRTPHRTPGERRPPTGAADDPVLDVRDAGRLDDPDLLELEGEMPLEQPHPADADGVVPTLVRAGRVPIEGHGQLEPHLPHATSSSGSVRTGGGTRGRGRRRTWRPPSRPPPG